jgi:thiamine biosynthesis lipoprotein
VITDNGTLSDALSTACFVLGAEKGMELAKKMGAEAIFILETGEYLSTVTPEEYENSSQRYVFQL